MGIGWVRVGVKVGMGLGSRLGIRGKGKEYGLSFELRLEFGFGLRLAFELRPGLGFGVRLREMDQIL